MLLVEFFLTDWPQYAICEDVVSPISSNRPTCSLILFKCLLFVNGYKYDPCFSTRCTT
uniref:Uncharacterized protein n=1 Tax=Arundo donax TaxID=35708 RepID=A0A0A9AXC4_ARUDO